MGQQFRVPGRQRFGRRTVCDDAEQHGDGDDGDGAIRGGASQLLQREYHRRQAPGTEPGHRTDASQTSTDTSAPVSATNGTNGSPSRPPVVPNASPPANAAMNPLPCIATADA